MYHKSSRRWHTNEWARLGSNTILFMDTDISISYNFHGSRNSFFILCFQPCQCVKTLHHSWAVKNLRRPAFGSPVVVFSVHPSTGVASSNTLLKQKSIIKLIKSVDTKISMCQYLGASLLPSDHPVDLFLSQCSFHICFVLSHQSPILTESCEAKCFTSEEN